MCFYEKDQYSCGDSQWGRLYQQCNPKNRFGEGCGFKLVTTTVHRKGKCKVCEQIDRKRHEAVRLRRYRVETRSVNHDSQVFFATLRALELEMNQLQSQRPRQLQSLDDVNPASSPMLDSTDPGTFVGFPRPPLELPSSTATNIPPI